MKKEHGYKAKNTVFCIVEKRNDKKYKFTYPWFMKDKWDEHILVSNNDEETELINIYMKELL